MSCKECYSHRTGLLSAEAYGNKLATALAESEAQLAACRAALRKAVDALNWVSMTVYERDALRDDLAALDAALADGGEG